MNVGVARRGFFVPLTPVFSLGLLSATPDSSARGGEGRECVPNGTVVPTAKSGNRSRYGTTCCKKYVWRDSKRRKLRLGGTLRHAPQARADTRVSAWRSTSKTCPHLFSPRPLPSAMVGSGRKTNAVAKNRWRLNRRHCRSATHRRKAVQPPLVRPRSQKHQSRRCRREV